MSNKQNAPATDPIGEISRLLPRIYKKYRAPYARRVRGSDITVRGALLLRAVSVLPEATVGNVAREMAVTASTASIVLSGLERKGLLRRRYRVLGRSRTALELTPAGRRALAALRPSLDPGLLAAALRRMTVTDRGMLLRALRRLDAVDATEVIITS
jgi:DNA-binding MarR family transcriptional regulator